MDPPYRPNKVMHLGFFVWKGGGGGGDGRPRRGGVPLLSQHASFSSVFFRELVFYLCDTRLWAVHVLNISMQEVHAY